MQPPFKLRLISKSIGTATSNSPSVTPGATTETNPSLHEPISKTLELLTAYSLPVYVDDEHGSPDLIGTGFIVKDGSQHYFVTATHLFNHRDRGSLYFYIDTNTKRYVAGPLRRSPMKGSEAEDVDHIDIAVVKIEGNSLPPYPDIGKLAVNIEHLSPQRLPRDGKTYAFVGHPISRSKVRNDKKSVHVQPVAYYNKSIASNLYPDWLNCDTHIVVGWDGKKSFDSRGTKTHFLKPEGMSGSPIIELYDTQDSDSVDFFPIVGVATDYRKKKKIIYGSEIKFVLDMILALKEDSNS